MVHPVGPLPPIACHPEDGIYLIEDSGRLTTPAQTEAIESHHSSIHNHILQEAGDRLPVRIIMIIVINIIGMSSAN